MKYKVLITTSGIGSRLGELTNYTNKSLIRVGKKPALSYIIEKYDKDVPLVITIGHFKEHVKEFCELAYPERNITFVEVDNYKDQGSSMGYSLLQAKNELQCPFILNVGDCIIEDNPITSLENNWAIGFKSEESSEYSSFSVCGNDIVSFNPKGEINYDYIHIGLIGIKDYKFFWEYLEQKYNEDKNNSSLNDVMVLKEFLNNGISIKYIQTNKWLDIGNVSSLNKSREIINDHFENLDKLDESIFLFDDFVIKFFYNQKNINQRIIRTQYLKGLIPNIIDVKNNFYKYEYADGEVFSKIINGKNFEEFLKWAKENLFVEVDYDKEEFYKLCNEFYKEKTLSRIKQFQNKYRIIDESDIINGIKIPKLEELIDKIDFNNLNSGVPSKFHGDFHFENIIYNKFTNKFKLIDWRHNFSGICECGDLYYDLAKLYHGIIVNHGIIKKNLFEIEVSKNEIKCEILRLQTLVECEKIYLDFLEKNNYDIRKVKILTALIYLNIATLHHHPYDYFLYYFGKKMLHEVLE